MKTGTVVMLAVILPFGSVLLAGMLMHRWYCAYRTRRAAVAVR
jgi:hypothetical protein